MTSKAETLVGRGFTNKNRAASRYSFAGVRFSRLLAMAAGIAVLLMAGTDARAQVNVTTFQNDIGRTGQNLNETILTPSTVNASQFGKLFSHSVDADIYAQPLYLSGVNVNGAAHNVVYVATENDSVYAFDGDSNGGANASPLWFASMLTSAHGAASGATAVPSSLVSTDIQPLVGITGTPVIDPASGTLYVVSKSLESGKLVQRLHALDVTSGAEKFGGPVVITASVAGSGNGSSGGILTFDPSWENQRPALLLLNGIVWIGFASHGDNGPWHGWVLGYNASTLKQTGAYCASPNGTGAGIWMSGGGLVADQLDPVNKPYGRMFFPTGNGDYTATKPYSNSMDYGDSEVVLDLTNGVPTITDEFTTNQQASLDAEDGDIASGGMMAIPTQTTGPTPHLAVQVGKQGWMYLLNRDNMGGYNSTDQIVQEQEYVVGVNGAWSSPAYWNGNVYWWGRFDSLKSFPLVNGLLSTSPSKSVETYGYPGATPTISANGSTQGIVWSIDSEAYGAGPAVLQAHNASSVSTLLYSSAASGNASRDQAGGAVKFATPTVANGKVYVGASGELDFYGLLSGSTPAAAPVISPGSESFNGGSVSVTITDTTPNAQIFYTTNGSPATTSSTLYTGAITVNGTETINAIASATGFVVSAQSSATYTNTAQAPVVTFSLPTGTYNAVQSLTLSDSASGASIYYTTNGATPTTASTLYTGPIAINSTETITAIATVPGENASTPLAQTYTIVLGATGIQFTQGFGTSAGLVILNGSSQLNDTRLQLTDGLTNEAGSAFYYQPVGVQTFTTDFNFQLSNPLGEGIAFVIQNASQGSAAVGSNGAGLGYAGIGNSLAIKFDLFSDAGEGADSTGLYTNGASPTVPSIDLSSTGINLHSNDDMAIHLTYDGTTLTMTITDIVTGAVWSTNWTINIPATIGSNTAYVGFTGSTSTQTASQKILNWSYFTTPPAATPTFSPAAGTYTSTQSVTIKDTTTGATIYYTTNGTTPTTASTVYSAPVSVSAAETLNAIAVAPNFTTSVTGTAAYTIQQPAATPVFSLAGGTYTGTQSVTISDATTGATIYYTTNGSTPTTASSVYSGAITVSASETLKAIAIATGFSNSAVASATYTISSGPAAPTFSPAAGTYTGTQTVTLSDTTPGCSFFYQINGVGTAFQYTGPITVSSTESIVAIAVDPNYNSSARTTSAYTINTAAVATPTFSVAAGTYTSAQTVSITDTTAGATIYYTTNGAAPTTSSTVYSGPITVSTTETLKAIANTSSLGNSAVASAAYTINPPAATPAFSVAAGTYTSAQTVSITDTTAGATIYYTTNGATPTTSSTVYSGPITVNTTETLKAAAIAANFSLSAVASAAYTINLPGATATPVFSVAAGTYTSAQTVSITDTTAGAAIYYTTNGTTPTTSSTAYSGPITVGTTETLKAVALATNFSLSAVASAAYTINLPAAATPVFSVAAGTYASAQTVSITDATTGATIYYTTNGTTPTTSSTVYSGPITVSATETLKAIAASTGLANSAVASATYTISSGPAAPTFTPAAGTYTGTQTVTLSDTTPGCSFFYQFNGVGTAFQYTGPITVSSSESIVAIAVDPSYNSSARTTAAYTINTAAVATPTFSVPAGTYTSAQTVSITDATAGATIYYTTNGATPTTSSTVYSGPITVNTTETLKAIASTSSLGNSTVASAAYTINLAATARIISFSPTSLTFPATAPGITSAAQTLTVTNSSSAAVSVSSYNFSGTNASQFSLSGKTCGTSLAAGASCTLSITFTASAPGTATANLVATYNAAGSPQSVPLSGSELPVATVSFSPTSLSFPTTKSGSTSAAQVLTVTNTSSTTAMAVSSYQFSGTSATQFSILGKTCVSSLPAGASCTLSIVFKPAAAGSASASLVATDNAVGSPQSVPLRGTGN